MGTLTPGASYIYERTNGITYAREVGSDPDTRRPIGWDYDRRNDKSPRLGALIKPAFHDYIREDKMWVEIRNEAKNNPTLQKALDRVIMIYKLSKDKL
jgi:hypothetical protein